MATKTATKKKATAKKSVKKTAAKRAPAKKSVKRVGDSVRLRVLKLLVKNSNGLKGSQVMNKLGLKGIPAVLKHEAMRQDKPVRIKRETREEIRGTVYLITAAGKTAIKEGKVDSEPAPTSVGKS